MKQQGSALVYILVGILIVAGVVGGVYSFRKSQVTNLKLEDTPATTSPEKVVETFYNTWLNCEKEFDRYSLKMDRVPQEIIQQRENCIKSALKDHTIVQKEYPMDNSMWCAQDLPLRVGVNKAAIFNQTATVISHHFFEHSGDNQIKVTLTSVDNSWKISDTTCLHLNPMPTPTNLPTTDYHKTEFLDEPLVTKENDGWATYTKASLGFSFRLPQGFSRAHNYPGRSEVAVDDFFDLKTDQQFSVSVQQEPVDLDQLISINPLPDTINKTFGLINGTLIRQDGLGAGGSIYGQNFIFSKNNYHFWISLGTGHKSPDIEKTKKDADELFERILSTFKFLN